MSAAADKVGVLAVLTAIAERASTYRWNERGGVDSANLLWLDERDKNAVAAVAEVIERLQASDWRLSNLLALIPEGRPERTQIEQDMADNRAALARVGGAS